MQCPRCHLILNAVDINEKGNSSAHLSIHQCPACGDVFVLNADGSARCLPWDTCIEELVSNALLQSRLDAQAVQKLLEDSGLSEGDLATEHPQ